MAVKAFFRRAYSQLKEFANQIQKQAALNPLATLVLLATLVIFLGTLVETIRRGNMGFGTKSFWDWMDLLIVPIVVAVAAWWLNRTEKRTEREVARDKQNHETLQHYFDRMTDLLMSADVGAMTMEEAISYERLREIEIAIGIARARTLTVLRALDPTRVSAVFRFLHDTKIGDRTLDKFVSLKDGDLGRVDWKEADLVRVNLRGAYLAEANLQGASLWGGNLQKAHLLEANLQGAYLIEANLQGAILWRANLQGALLIEANLEGANLWEAHVLPDQLLEAKSLEGATMPDGSKYEEWVERGRPDWTQLKKADDAA